ncbi:hypothetical protein FBEOM_9353 [Fusarium beomiforme]|uniref:F-box domain-containing protein n=1 Tax=Fusarium beomiforme TaxID=44412 RepID=A0A9P5ADR2_9HYPO|nr:hypothetical protein FBEOM_9353 [Fusarium beomiforme]
MDFLTRLPAELYLHILSYFDLGADLTALMSACPPMVPWYCNIRRSFHNKVLDKRMLQDAVAIVSFPSLKELQYDYGSAASHISKWKQAEFLDPFEHNDYVTINLLDKLYVNLSTFIEDFITKATAEYPCRAYMGLPDLTSTQGRLLFQERPMGFEVLKLDQLNPDEAKRLFRTFLQYEVLCKFHRRDHGCIRSRSFDARIEAAYGEFQDWELESLRSIYDYVKGLYGAFCAQCLSSPLPDPATVLFDDTDSSRDTGLKFPDNVYYNGECYRSDLQELIDPLEANFSIAGNHLKDVTYRTLDNDMHEFALLGFDPIARFLTLAKDERNRPLALLNWLAQKCESSAKTWLYTSDYQECLMEFGGLKDPNPDSIDQASGLYRALRHKVPPWNDTSRTDLSGGSGDGHSLMMQDITIFKAFLYIFRPFNSYGDKGTVNQSPAMKWHVNITDLKE